MGTGAKVRKGEVLAADPIGGLALVGAADKIGVHRANFHTVYIQVDHIASVSSYAVFQAVGMLRCGVDAGAGKGNTVIVVISGGAGAKGEEIVFVPSVEIAGIGRGAGVGLGKE